MENHRLVVLTIVQITKNSDPQVKRVETMSSYLAGLFPVNFKDSEASWLRLGKTLPKKEQKVFKQLEPVDVDILTHGWLNFKKKTRIQRKNLMQVDSVTLRPDIHLR